MSFWGVELLPGKKYEHEPEEDVHVTSITLSASAKSKERNSVQCEVNGGVFTLATLRLDTKDQESTDLFFEAGQPVTFFITGKDPVHLLGYFTTDDDMPPYDDDDSDEEQFEMDADLRNRLMAAGALDDMDDSEDDEGEVADVPPPKQIEAPKKGNKKGSQSKPATPELVAEAPGKRKNEGAQTPNSKKNKADPKTPTQAETPAAETPKNEKKKSKKEAKSAASSPAATNPTTPVGTPKPQVAVAKQMPNGLQISDIVIGSGEVAKPGSFIRVKYVGKLDNGKQFDAMTKNTGFKFRFGAGEVIKGWDIGLKGMRVGGKRTLVIPAALGYGAQGAGSDIPANATLHFDVELVGVGK